MKTRIIIGLISAFISMQSISAQKAMVKLGGGLFPQLAYKSIALSYDLGFEYKLNKNYSAELSTSFSGFKSNLDHFTGNLLLSLQTRYYFNGERWKMSPFVGLVLQKQYKTFEEYTDNLMENIFISDQRIQNKVGLGPILGQHLQIVDILGLDFHVGGLVQVGKETHITREHGNTPTTTTVKHNLWNLRPFWGVNLYFAIGKMK